MFVFVEPGRFDKVVLPVGLVQAGDHYAFGGRRMNKTVFLKENSNMILENSGLEKQEIARMQGICRDFSAVTGLFINRARQFHAENIMVGNDRKT